MTVWILSQAFRFEPPDILGLFSTLEKAYAWAKDNCPRDDSAPVYAAEYELDGRTPRVCLRTEKLKL
jgi:hypothetical protein